jgi:hypothetical protein
VITNVNGSTTPTAPVGFLMEVNGTSFGSSPGAVRFNQGANFVDQLPSAASWSDTSIAVVAPSSFTNPSAGSFTVPGAVSVTVIRAGDGAQSNAVGVSLVATTGFSPSNVSWTATTSLPEGRCGHRVVATRASGVTSSAFVYILGGCIDLTTKTSTATVLSNTVDQDGNIGATWTAQPALPTATAFHAAAEADPTNAPVPAGSAFVYVLGGQSAPGVTVTSVFSGSVNPATGAIASWTPTTSLPSSAGFLGLRAAVSNGFLYITGGYTVSGTATNAVFSAPIAASGALGAFTQAATATASIPEAVAFHDSFAFGGFLFTCMGESGASGSTDPFGTASGANSGSATKSTHYAQILRGAVGAWDPNGSSGQGSKARTKHAALEAFGQVIVIEGLYGNTSGAGSSEAETSAISSSAASIGSLGSFNGLTGSRTPSLNTFNCAGLVSPLTTGAGNPRFLLFGGETYASTPVLSATCVRTTAP